ncbi:hypothetical protein MTO96_012794 [Rhipicephalus appendiculatus]
MPRKQAEGDEDRPKAGRQVKSQAGAAADNAAGPSNEDPAAKRPRGRPPKAVSEEPLAPKPIATTAVRKLRKKADVSHPANENPSTGKAVDTKAPRKSRRKRSRSSFPSISSDTASQSAERRKPLLALLVFEKE